MADGPTRDANEAADRLRAALAMFETGVEMKRQTLRRENPGLTELERRRGCERGSGASRRGVRRYRGTPRSLASPFRVRSLEAVLRSVALDLADLHLRWALVGGLAVSARTEPRFTRDIDLVIAAAGDRDAEQAVHALQRRGYRVHALVEQEAASRLATARLVPRGEDDAGIVLDVLFASSGIEPEIADAAEPLGTPDAASRCTPDVLERETGGPPGCSRIGGRHT
jgi:hypothetical protein